MPMPPALALQYEEFLSYICKMEEGEERTDLLMKYYTSLGESVARYQDTPSLTQEQIDLRQELQDESFFAYADKMPDNAERQTLIMKYILYSGMQNPYHYPEPIKSEAEYCAEDVAACEAQFKGYQHKGFLKSITQKPSQPVPVSIHPFFYWLLGLSIAVCVFVEVVR